MKINILPLLALTWLGWSVQAQSYFHNESAVATFGGAAGISEGRLFIGEPSGFRHPGTVHIYAERDGAWQLVHHVQAPDARVGDSFGNLLQVDGTTLLVASDDAVHFFTFDGSRWHPVLRAAHRSSSLALDGDLALVGVTGRKEEAGAVHVYRKSGDMWAAATSLTGVTSQFGGAVALSGGVALVGADESVAFYRWNEGSFHQEAQFSGPDLGVSRGFGTAVAVNGTEAMVGSVMDQERVGTTQVFRYGEHWQLERNLRPSGAPQGSMFGATVASNADGYWVGAPMAERGAGAVYFYPRTEEAETIFSPGDDAGAFLRYGTALAVAEDLVAVGMPGAAYGEGSAELLIMEGGTWRQHTELYNAADPMSPVLGEGARCDAGGAAGFECGQVDLVSFLPLTDMGTNRGVRLSDVWGWTDLETGKEYGLVGHLEGTAFVDLSDPSAPVFLGELPRTAGSPGSTWRDIKVYRDHAFIVADGAGAHGMQVFDLTRLRAVPEMPAVFDADVLYDRIHSAHNVAINEETGFAFAVGASGGGQTCGGGLHMIDIREPKAPAFAGCFADATTGRRKTGYSHDAQCVVYHGPDAAYHGREICVGANETAISIADITDKEHPVVISSGSYPDAMYVHQGWLSEDHAFFYQNDELDEISQRVDRTRTLIWDVSDLDDPVLASEYYGPTSATDHNLYVRDNLMYQTNNASGLRILDITNRAEPKEVGFFDTTPYGNNNAGFNGTWSSFPYFESGIIVVTSRREGLFILRKQSVGS